MLRLEGNATVQHLKQRLERHKTLLDIKYSSHECICKPQELELWHGCICDSRDVQYEFEIEPLVWNTYREYVRAHTTPGTTLHLARCAWHATKQFYIDFEEWLDYGDVNTFGPSDTREFRYTWQDYCIEELGITYNPDK